MNSHTPPSHNNSFLNTGDITNANGSSSCNYKVYEAFSPDSLQSLLIKISKDSRQANLYEEISDFIIEKLNDLSKETKTTFDDLKVTNCLSTYEELNTLREKFRAHSERKVGTPLKQPKSRSTIKIDLCDQKEEQEEKAIDFGELTFKSSYKKYSNEEKQKMISQLEQNSSKRENTYKSRLENLRSNIEHTFTKIKEDKVLFDTLYNKRTLDTEDGIIKASDLIRYVPRRKTIDSQSDVSNGRMERPSEMILHQEFIVQANKQKKGKKSARQSRNESSLFIVENQEAKKKTQENIISIADIKNFSSSEVKKKTFSSSYLVKQGVSRAKDKLKRRSPLLFSADESTKKFSTEKVTNTAKMSIENNNSRAKVGKNSIKFNEKQRLKGRTSQILSKVDLSASTVDKNELIYFKLPKNGQVAKLQNDIVKGSHKNSITNSQKFFLNNSNRSSTKLSPVKASNNAARKSEVSNAKTTYTTLNPQSNNSDNRKLTVIQNNVANFEVISYTSQVSGQENEGSTSGITKKNFAIPKLSDTVYSAAKEYEIIHLPFKEKYNKNCLYASQFSMAFKSIAAESELGEQIRKDQLKSPAGGSSHLADEYVSQHEFNFNSLREGVDHREQSLSQSNSAGHASSRQQNCYSCKKGCLIY